MQSFAGVNTYTGSTTITAGSTLGLVPGGTLGTGLTLVNPGGVLDTSGYTAGYNFNAGVLTAGRTDNSFLTDVNGSLNLLPGGTLSPAGSVVGMMTINGGMNVSGGSIAFDQFRDPNTNLVSADQFNLSAALTSAASGTTWIVPTGPVINGNFTVFSGPIGSISPSVTANFQGGGPFTQTARPLQFTFSVSAGSNALIMGISGGAANLTWTGTNAAAMNNNVWDEQTTQNFFNTQTQMPDVFFDGDLVTFDDTAGMPRGNVSISGPVLPGNVTVSNTAVNYTFGGGAIAVAWATSSRTVPAFSRSTPATVTRAARRSTRDCSTWAIPPPSAAAVSRSPAAASTTPAAAP